MERFDNVNQRVIDDLKEKIQKGSKLSIVAGCFSIYAYQALKKELNGIGSLRFIFNSPTFVKEKIPKAKREFYIPRLSRERSLYGTEFEVRLRNELTQKAIARECADWVRKKVQFRSNRTPEMMQGFMAVDTHVYMPFEELTTVGLGCEKGNYSYMNMIRLDQPEGSLSFLQTFESIWKDKEKLQDVTDIVIDSISNAYKENAPEFIYFYTIYHIFREFLDDISGDTMPNEATGFRDSRIWKMLYNFQRDAAIGIIHKLEKYNGCILADSVGLGKTFTALAVIKYYENRNKSVLVLCPKKLGENWLTYKGNYVNNPLAADRLRYDVLYHTDLSRKQGQSNGIDLARLRWDNYDLIVIDESHNFRNGGNVSGEDQKENRYLTLLHQVIQPGVQTKVLMLSATPVNNRFNDLKNQLALAYEGQADRLEEKLDTNQDLESIFKNAQKAFNAWSKLPAKARTADELLRRLSMDFFTVLDSCTIARSRKHIANYYDMADIGRFPDRLPPISCQPRLTDLPNAINYKEIYEGITSLYLTVYTPSNFIQPSRQHKYADPQEGAGKNLTRRGREEGIRRLMAVNLMKRLESSVYAFRLTLRRVEDTIDEALEKIRAYEAGQAEGVLAAPGEESLTDDEREASAFLVGKDGAISLADMDVLSWKRELEEDKEGLSLLRSMVADITPAHDGKLQHLLALIREKIRHPINGDNKKILIFTAFANTADYLYQEIAPLVRKEFGLDTAEVTGHVEGRSTIPKLRCDLNTVLTCFSPRSKEKEKLMPGSKDEIQILIATDCISEGQNLQDCDYVVNYDIHWNPVRIIQRFGRVDRIGSANPKIQLVNFWPDMDLDEYLNLENRVKARMGGLMITGAGGDNPIDPGMEEDLEYRKKQLEKLRKEVVDIEDINGGVSIMDLGLNEFRMDLAAYMKEHGDLDHAPSGMHAVAAAAGEAKRGVLFVLKNIHDTVNIDKKNRIHPFYMVYIGEDGEILCDYLQPKKMLDTMRFLCKGRDEPIPELCHAFNVRTKDGKDMRDVSELLSDAINSIVDVKEESDIDSLFRGGGTTALRSSIAGLDDFELLCFLVVE